MDKRDEQSPQFNPTGLTIGSILALTVAMVISLVLDIQPSEAEAGTGATPALLAEHG